MSIGEKFQNTVEGLVGFILALLAGGLILGSLLAGSVATGAAFISGDWKEGLLTLVGTVLAFSSGVALVNILQKSRNNK